ncbi:hypothetical protein JCM3765_000862 [Sporobolomyces pararoseus]
MSFLPPLGSTYPSLAHFKFDVYTRAANACQSFEEMETQPNSFCRLVCSDLGPKSYGVVGRCSSAIFCGRRLDGHFEVISREEVHTCEGWESSRDPFGTKIKMLFKVNAQVQAISELVSSEGHPVHESGKIPGGIEREAEVSRKFEEIEEKVDERKAGVRGQETVTRGIQTVDRVDENHSWKELGIPDDCFPQVASPQNRIDELKSTSFGLPTTDETFSTLGEIFARIYAFAQKQGVLLKCSTAISSATEKVLVCSHNAQEYDQVRGGRCPVVYKIARTQSRNWSLSNPILTHSHPIFETYPIPPVVSELLQSTRTDNSDPPPQHFTFSNSPPHSSVSQLPLRQKATQVLPSQFSSKKRLLLPPPPPPPPPSSLDGPCSLSPPSYFKLPPPSASNGSSSSKRKAESISPLSPSKVSRISHSDAELQLKNRNQRDCEARQEEEEDVTARQANESTSSSIDSITNKSSTGSRLSHSRSSTSSPLTSVSPTPPPLIATSTEKASSDPFSSFLRSFNLSSDIITSTLSCLHNQRIHSLDCLVELLSIRRQPLLIRLVEGFKEEEMKGLLIEMRRSLQEFEEQP